MGPGQGKRTPALWLLDAIGLRDPDLFGTAHTSRYTVAALVMSVPKEVAARCGLMKVRVLNRVQVLTAGR